MNNILRPIALAMLVALGVVATAGHASANPPNPHPPVYCQIVNGHVECQ